MSLIAVSPLLIDIENSPKLVALEKNAAPVLKVPLLDPAQSGGNCGELTGIKCSFRMRPTISSGDDRNAPIGPHSQVQNASARKTASAFSASLRPMIVGVMKCPSMNAMATKAS